MSNPAMAESDPAALSTGDGEPDRYLTTAQAAELLGLARSTLEKWRVHKTGPRFCAPRPGVVRYALSDLHAFMRDGEGRSGAVRG